MSKDKKQIRKNKFDFIKRNGITNNCIKFITRSLKKF